MSGARTRTGMGRYRAYPEYKESGVEWLGEVPGHWGVKRLKYISTVNDDTWPEDTNPDQEIIYVDISSVDSVAGITHKEKMTFESSPSRARRIVQDGDVIISTVRTYLRAIARIENPEPGLTASTGFAVIRSSSDLSDNFAAYALRSPYFIEGVVAHSEGVSYPAINASEMACLAVALPPKEEQRAIAAFLDRETAKIDALIQKKQRLIELLQEKRTALITHAVTKGLDPDVPMKESGVEWLGEIPEHWRVRRIKRLFFQAKRQHHPDLTVLSVYRDYGVIEKSSRDDNINRTPEDLSVYQLVNEGDLVINKMKAWQGSLGISEKRGITSPDYLVYIPLHSDSRNFLHHLLRSRPLASVYRSISNGIRPDQWRLEPEKFERLMLWVPKLEEQERISSYIDTETRKIDDLVGKVSQAIHHLQEYRTALISAAVTGKIDVRTESEDEKTA